MASNNNNPETAPKTPTLTESVDSLIAKKKAEKANEGASAVQQSAENVQGEVADVMAGVEGAKETISERSSENKGDGDIKGGGGGKSDDDTNQIAQGVAQYVFPGEDVMIRKVRVAIKSQIKKEERLAKKLEKNLMNGSAQEYNSAIARIRKLKIMLSSLVTATVKVAKDLYQKYFTPRGLRRPLREVDVD